VVEAHVTEFLGVEVARRAECVAGARRDEAGLVVEVVEAVPAHERAAVAADRERRLRRRCEALVATVDPHHLQRGHAE
jgi:hypothetical protein